MSVVHNGQLKLSDFSESNVDILLDINQLNFRFYIDRIQNARLALRLFYLDMVNLGASATLPLRYWCSAQPHAWFKCSPKVGVAI